MFLDAECVAMFGGMSWLPIPAGGGREFRKACTTLNHGK